MIIIAGEARIGEASLDAAREAARVMAEKSTAEDGCHVYSFAEDLNEPGLFRIFEKWETQEALDAHFQTPHMADFQAAMATWDVQSVKATKYQIAAAEDMMS